jgi:hypothetical protein
MGTTTFSGPIKAGDKREGANANVGFTVMAQSAAVTEVNAFGTTSDTDLFVDGLSVASVGNHRVNASSTGTEANWKNTGSSDQTLVFISPGTGNGAGILTVEYIQNNNLA